jgi:hypothetical protein
MGTRFLSGLLRRDAPTSPELARFFINNAVNPHPNIRQYAQRLAGVSAPIHSPSNLSIGVLLRLLGSLKRERIRNRLQNSG